MSLQIFPRSYFAVELVESILEHIYGEYESLQNPLDLFQCALVCRDWRLIAQRLIFAELHLAPGGEGIKIFQEDDKHHLLVYVRRVWMHDAFGGIEDNLSSLPNLRQIYALAASNTASASRDPNQWPYLKRIKIFTGDHLTTLGLASTFFPVKILRHCTSLRELSIEGCLIDQEDVPRGGPVHAAPLQQLHSFDFRAWNTQTMEVLWWMLGPQGPFDFTKLRTLRISDRTDLIAEHAATQALVTQCAATVRDLMVSPQAKYAWPSTNLTPERLFHPSNLTNLRSIRISIRQELYGHINFVPWMTAFFSSLPGDTKLEEIFIPSWFPEYPHIEFDDDIGDYNWGSLDDVLSSRIPRLKQVIISAYGPGAKSGPLSSTYVHHIIVPGLLKAFPKLTQRSMLRVINSLDIGYVSREECWWNRLIHGV
ncbi:hypothetical protein BDN72DRAFT_839414 [Pluteus cervinus]|uniref:Uncharacterized protein n=1 Tax=Pluteus cervinus TaxID=181527 RepID=A0ACD3AWV8_9AGAR|nr:hypothetical protein BDN72DRAFT_839414 [Pluteus cervinus]